MILSNNHYIDDHERYHSCQIIIISLAPSVWTLFQPLSHQKNGICLVAALTSGLLMEFPFCWEALEVIEPCLKGQKHLWHRNEQYRQPQIMLISQNERCSHFEVIRIALDRTAAPQNKSKIAHCRYIARQQEPCPDPQVNQTPSLQRRCCMHVRP